MGVTDTGTEQLLCDFDDGIALVTFNNPTKHNALSAPIRDALPRVLRALQADDAVRVVVLTGAGGKAFVSGADISEFGTQRTTPEARADFDAGQVDAGSSVDRAREADHRHDPRLSASAAVCSPPCRPTFASAATTASSACPPLGSDSATGSAASTSSCSSSVRRGRARSCSRRGGSTASEALHVGLVNRVVPTETLRDEVWSLAGSIRDNAPLTVRSLKAAIREARRDPSSSAISRSWRRWSRRASAPTTTGRGRPRSWRSGPRRSAGAEGNRRSVGQLQARPGPLRRQESPARRDSDVRGSQVVASEADVRREEVAGVHVLDHLAGG